MTAPSASPQRSAKWDNAQPGDTLTLDAAYCCDAQSPTGALCTSATHPAGTRHVATAAGVVEETWGAA